MRSHCSVLAYAMRIDMAKTHLFPENWPNHANVMFNIVLYLLARVLNNTLKSKKFRHPVTGSLRNDSIISAISSATSGWSGSPFAWCLMRKSRASSWRSLPMSHRGDSGKKRMTQQTRPGQTICSQSGRRQSRFPGRCLCAP
jgi:hypothetical protein